MRISARYHSRRNQPENELTFASTIRSLAGIFLAMTISAGICLAETPDPDEPESDIEAARRVAGELLVPISEAYFCKFTRISVVRNRSGDGYVVNFVCNGEKCDEALHHLNYRGQRSGLSFNQLPPPERSRSKPEIFDLIHEIDPPADIGPDRDRNGATQ